jgi:hypothetical protein
LPARSISRSISSKPSIIGLESIDIRVINWPFR